VFSVPTVVRPSPIQGFGVFAASPIPAGTVIWEFTPGVDWRFTPDEFAAMPEPWLGALRRWCYRDEDDTHVLCGDAAKFMNHSDDPNCDDRGGTTITWRDIEAGEELTCDYRGFDVDSRLAGIDFTVNSRNSP
jgi:SET domain-containing protein